MTNKITDIDFDGAKLVNAVRDGTDLIITVNALNKTGSIEIVFLAVTEEKATLFKEKNASIENSHFPPLDVIETFEEKNGKYILSGYLNNVPWSVWEFKASNYVIS